MLPRVLGGGNGMLPFTHWQQRGLAAAHPTSPLARIAAVVDGLANESASAVLQDSPVGEQVIGGDVHPMPMVTSNLYGGSTVAGASY